MDEKSSSSLAEKEKRTVCSCNDPACLCQVNHGTHEHEEPCEHCDEVCACETVSGETHECACGNPDCGCRHHE